MPKYLYPLELENLTPAQLDQFHAWLDEHSYRIVQQKVETEFSIKISTRKLCEYNQRRELAEDISGDADIQLGVRDLTNIMNGAETPYDDATVALISQKNFFYLLHQRDITVNKLMLCHRIATYKEQLQITQRRLTLAEHKRGLSIEPTAQSTPPAIQPSVCQRLPTPTPRPTSTPRPCTQPLSSREKTPLRENRAKSATNINRAISAPPVLSPSEWSALLSKPCPPSSPKGTTSKSNPSTVRDALTPPPTHPNILTFPSPLDSILAGNLLKPKPTSCSGPTPAQLASIASLIPPFIPHAPPPVALAA